MSNQAMVQVGNAPKNCVAIFGVFLTLPNTGKRHNTANISSIQTLKPNTSLTPIPLKGFVV
jgi:hypothetical protein